MIAESFFARWVWPAGGSGGIPGDVVGSLVWAVVVAIAAAIFYPPLRHFVRREWEHAHAKWDHNAELLRHVIEHHPDIPSDILDRPSPKRGRPSS